LVMSGGYKYPHIAVGHTGKESFRTTPSEGSMNELESHPYKNEFLALLNNTP
jgi:hypothetical protein